VQSIAGERVFAGMKRVVHAQRTPEELLREAVVLLKKVVPFEGYAASVMDPLSGVPTGPMVFNREMGGREDVRFFFEHIYFEDDVNEYGWMARKGLATARLSDGTGGRLERALRYREFGRPRGFGHEMRAAMTMDGELWGGLCLAREKGDPDFSAKEAAFIEGILPHLTAGLRAAALRSGTGSRTSDGEPIGVLVLDRRGQVVQRAGGMDRWLEELGMRKPYREDGSDLPEAVWALVGMLKRTLAPRKGEDESMVPHLHVRGRSGRWLSLQASIGKGQDGSATQTVVVAAPSGPRELARINVATYGLSGREREIANLVLRAHSTRQISRALYISESTVQGHLSHVFEKVGVRSRRELLKRLFFSSFPPEENASPTRPP